jgi:hypothetical protein
MSSVFELFTPELQPFSSRIENDASAMFKAGMGATRAEAGVGGGPSGPLRRLSRAP